MKTISFKVSDEDARRIRRLARSERLTVSEFLRRRSVGEPSQPTVTKTRCAHTGAKIFAPLPDEPPLTTERVREMLTEFP
jgi:hypothetical protein